VAKSLKVIAIADNLTGTKRRKKQKEKETRESEECAINGR
jgi:hypothetical protein